MLKEARIKLHLVEDGLGLQDRVTEEPRAVTGARELERQKESSPEMDGYLGAERSSLDIATNPETADWSFLSGEILHKNQAQKSRESQGSQGPSLGQESWNPRNSALSLSSLTQDRRRQLLKAGSPRGRTLDRLQQRICQQKLKHRNGEGDEGPIHTPVVTQRGPLVRKVRKVAFAPRLPAYRGLSTGREKTDRLEKPLFSDKLSTLKYGPRRLTGGQETADKTVGPVPLKKNAITNPSCLRISNAKPASRAPGVSAWKDAQRLVMQILGPPRQHPETQRENSAPPWTRDAQFPCGKTQGVKFPGEQKRSPFDVISNGKLSSPPNSQTFGREGHTPSENLNSKTLLEKCPSPSGRTSSISKERPAPLKSVPKSSSASSLHTRHGISNSSSSPQGSTFSAGPTSLSNDPLTPLTTLRSPDSASPTSALCRNLSGGKENVGVRRPAVSGSRRAEEVQAFMGQQERARRRKAQQEKQEALREKERRKNMMQEVLRKQQEALHKAQRSHHDRGVKERNRPTSSCKKEEPASLGPGEREQNMKKSGEPQQKRRPAVKKLKIRGQPMEGGSPLKLVDLASSPRKAQARRVEALRQAAAALGSRVEMQAALLGAGSGLTGRPVAEPTGPLNNRSLALALGGTSAQPRDRDSTSISEDLPWSEEAPECIAAQPGFLQQTATVRGAESRGEKSTENAGPATLSIWKPSRTRKGSRRWEEVIDKNQAGAHARREKDQKTSGPLGNSAKTSQEWGQDGARSSQVMGNTSPESSSSEAHTDSTSKWSEVSQFFGCGDMLNRLSLELSQQSLRDAELRDRQHVALFRLREEALKEKTQAELAWLEHQKM
nr:PREDICTED: centrosome-associated protein 350 [Lepisosteus oculatus]